MFRLFAAESMRTWRISLRYPIEFFGGIALLLLLLNGFLFGYGAIKIGGLAMPPDASQLIAGFICYMLAIAGLTHCVEDIENEAKTGALVNLFSAAYSPTQILVMRAMVALLSSTLTLLILILVEVIIFRVRFSLPMSSWIAIALLSALSAGIGMCFGALALRLKKVRIALTPVYILLPVLLSLDMAAMSKSHPWLTIGTPPFPALTILRAADGDSLGQLYVAALFWAALSMALGITLVRSQVRRVRRTGSAHEH